MKAYFVFLLALTGLSLSARADVGNATSFACQERNADGPSPTYGKDCQMEVTTIAADQCGAKEKDVKITRVTLIGSEANAAGGCNHSYEVRATVKGATCVGATDVLVKVVATRGGCMAL